MAQKNKGRRKFIGDISKISLVGAFLPLASAAGMPSEKAEPFGFLCVPYLQKVTENSAHFLFITKNKAHSWVE